MACRKKFKAPARLFPLRLVFDTAAVRFFGVRDGAFQMRTIFWGANGFPTR